MGGTSQASPHIAGMAVLAQQLAQQELNRQLTPDEFRDLLQETGTDIFDGDENGNGIVDGDEEDDNVANTGLTFQRADMLALAQEISIDDGTTIVMSLMIPILLVHGLTFCNLN